MKKIIGLTSVSIVALMLVSGCSSLEMSSRAEQGDQTIPHTAIYVGHHNSEDVLKAIKRAAHNEGWRVTEFRSEAVIVEKAFNSETSSAVIKYHNQHIYGENKTAPTDELLKLRHAIVDELKKEQKH